MKDDDQKPTGEGETLDKAFELISGGLSLENEEDLEKYLDELKESEPKTDELPENVEPITPPDRKQTPYELEMSKFLRVSQECDKRYEVLQLEGYPQDVFIIRDKETGLVTDQIYGVRNHVMKVLNDPIIKSPRTIGLVRVYGIKEKEATDFIKMWLSTKTGVEKRVSHFIGLGKPDQYCHSFDFVPKGLPFDHWNEILERVDNAEALIAYIASIFEHKSPRGQYVWLHGSGGDSKSVLSDALCQILGSAAVQINSVDSINRFFVGSNWLKRLVVCHEALPEVARNQRFKSMVADPMQEHEQKYQAQRQIPVHFKFILNSNHTPQIENIHADKRRIIYCPIKPFKGKAKKHSEIVAALVREFPDFLAYAFEVYDRVCGDKMIATKEQALNMVISQEELDFFYVMESCFYFVDYGNLPRDLKKKARIDLKQVLAIVRAKLNNDQAMLRYFDQKAFRKYLLNASFSTNLFSFHQAGNFYGLKGLVKRNGDLPLVYKPYRREFKQE